MAKQSRSAWFFASFFLLCLAVTLLLNLPVSNLLNRVPLPDSVQVTGVKGNLSSGQVNELLIHRFPVRQLGYQADYSCLFTISWCYQLDSVEGTAFLRLGALRQNIEVGKLDVEIPASRLNLLIPQLLVTPSGSLALMSDNVSIEQGRLTSLDATLVWKNAGILGEDLDLGNYQLELTKQDDQYQFSFQDLNATLDISGEGILLPNGSYRVNIEIKSKPGVDSRIKNILELIARKNGLNVYNINRSGRIDPRLLNFLFTLEK